MACSNLAIQLAWWIGPGLSSELLKANFQDNHFQLNEFLVVISNPWIWLSFSKLLEKTECCFMIGLSAGYDIQFCITLCQAALYVWKIGICGELDGPQHKVNTLAKSSHGELVTAGQPQELSTYLVFQQNAHSVEELSVDRYQSSRFEPCQWVSTTPEDYEWPWIHCILSHRLISAHRKVKVLNMSS